MSITNGFLPGSIRRAAAVLALAGTLGLAGCGTLFGGEVEVPQEPTVEELYNKANQQVQAEDWREAAAYFEEVERLYPYTVWARRSILMAAYSYYMLNKYTEAIGAAERFIALHAGNQDAPYAYYLKAVSLYEQIVDVGRDQANTQAALVALNDVVQRYPASPYAKDARLKIDLTLDHLAGKEMAIGRYYLRRGQHVAALNRFRTVVENFQTTAQVPEALYRLTECYVSLGLTSEAQKAASVLGYNYPGSDWYARSYTLLTGTAVALTGGSSEPSWFERAFGGIF
jgi:outer membrane protein assembly factor BamD